MKIIVRCLVALLLIRGTAFAQSGKELSQVDAGQEGVQGGCRCAQMEKEHQPEPAAHAHESSAFLAMLGHVGRERRHR